MIATIYQKLQDWRPKCLYCHFPLSVVVAIAQGQFLRAGNGRKSHICRWNCHPISHRSGLQRYKYCWLVLRAICGPHCHVRLSVIVAITWRHFIRARHGRKSRTCRLNFDAICCSSSGITISSFVAISLFPVVVRCYSHLLTLSASSPWSKTPGLASEL